jgi:hypothetical protein
VLLKFINDIAPPSLMGLLIFNFQKKEIIMLILVITITVAIEITLFAYGKIHGYF